MSDLTVSVEGKNVVVYYAHKIWIIDDLLSAALVEGRSNSDIREIIVKSDIIGINDAYIYHGDLFKCQKRGTIWEFSFGGNQHTLYQGCTCNTCKYMKCVDRYRC
jgi:hypothetical protein